jgi:hypothetical protein
LKVIPFIIVFSKQLLMSLIHGCSYCFIFKHPGFVESCVPGRGGATGLTPGTIPKRAALPNWFAGALISGPVIFIAPFIISGEINAMRVPIRHKPQFHL